MAIESVLDDGDYQTRDLDYRGRADRRAKQQSLHADIAALLGRANRGATSLVVPSDYLEVVITTA